MHRELPPPIGEHRDDILRIAARHGARNVRVFGSLLHGAFTDDSDLDLLVEMDPSHSAFFPAGLVVELEDLLARRVDVVTEAALHWCLRDQILREARPL